uniref:Protein odr-4 homolog n=1 Tax=Labrus bergylta TaxID=56723 RepID=A0A3Q3MFZ6_9LABR|nr:protein odr-4 homolog [Labrus bergylta]
MGRGYIVDDTVEVYLSKLCEQRACPVTGLLIGQSSAQRDFVIMATRTPQREESTAASRNCLDKEWVTEHARQVSRMLPGGLSVLGVFIIDDSDAKDTLMTLQQVGFMKTHRLCMMICDDLWGVAHLLIFRFHGPVQPIKSFFLLDTSCIVSVGHLS